MKRYMVILVVLIVSLLADGVVAAAYPGDPNRTSSPVAVSQRIRLPSGVPLCQKARVAQKSKKRRLALTSYAR